jgi:hypothetical protein
MDDDKSEAHALEAFEGLLEGLSALETLHIFVNHMSMYISGIVLCGLLTAYSRSAAQGRDNNSAQEYINLIKYP